MIGTKATVDSRAYDRSMASLGPDVSLHSVACPVFVEHVERDVVLVSSAEETAKDVYGALVSSGLQSDEAEPRHEFLATGEPAQFQRVAEVFLGSELGAVRVAHARPMGGMAWN